MSRFLGSTLLVVLVLAVLLGVAAPAPTRADDGEVTIAWSVWTGWMPFRLMKEKGFLDKRAAEHGVKIKLQEFKGYMDSVQAFAAEKVDGCAMTSMESLQPAANGIATVGILVNDISNGGDGVLVRGGTAIADLKGKSILLEEFSVSHYLLCRALATGGLSEADVKIKNTPGDDAGKAFLSDDGVAAVVTWNPHLFLAEEGGKGKVIFNSSQIPGEIVDLLVINGKVLAKSPKVAQALVDAWYDAMAMIENPATRAEAIKIMAEGAGASVEEFEKMLKGTILYTDATKGADFLEGAVLQETMKKVKEFSLAHELVKDPSVSVKFDASFVRDHLKRAGGK